MQLCYLKTPKTIKRRIYMSGLIMKSKINLNPIKMETNIQKVKEFNPYVNDVMVLINEVQKGNIEALPVYIYLKKMETTIKNALSIIQDSAVDDGMKYGQGEHLKDGSYFQVRSAPGKYIYSKWVQEAEAELKRRRELEKEAFNLSRHSQTVVDDETGEIVTPAQYYEGKQTIAIKIPKI